MNSGKFHCRLSRIIGSLFRTESRAWKTLLGSDWMYIVGITVSVSLYYLTLLQ